ncbi:hypothetical protein [Treponema sp.]|uniref:hypothetical protein n=1 Tax=Treponema sp. TaxID=166 RepID=UPI0025EEE5B1|nr:hypothetical protein [Treponema sp.]MBR4322296.1 hypothetical protein [Treponema sp.]
MTFVFEKYIVPISEFVLDEDSITINNRIFSNKNELDTIRSEILNNLDKGLVVLKKTNTPELVKFLCSKMEE